jgi:hypothetical protein
MRSKLVTIVAGLILSAAPSYAGAQQRSERAQPGGRSAEHRSERSIENANPQHEPDAARGLERAAERRSAPGIEHERATEHAGKEKASAKPESAGFFATVRRFFGFERSEERRSESGREHERASEQERGRGAERGGGNP